MNKLKPIITWTKTDEAPALASYSLLPIVKAFVSTAEIDVETKDISLAGRILFAFSDYLKENINDDFAYFNQLVKEKQANIIKLPNISASVTQLKSAISELKSKGYTIPEYPENPKTDEEKKIYSLYAKCLGSAVNPVLREGNSDRRVAPSVKAYAQKHPKKLEEWNSNSQTHVASMSAGDFFENEKSILIKKETTARIEFVDKNGTVTILKDNLKLLKNEILDSTFMSRNKLISFIESQIEDAKTKNLLFSVHLKATMMKISDPIIFGCFVSTFFKDVFEKHAQIFNKLNVNPDLGLVDLYNKITALPKAEQDEIKKDIELVYYKNPALAMVDSAKGITNLHAGNNVIIDASMPVVIRDGGKMWNSSSRLQDTKAIIPDRTYATIYQEIIQFCKTNGALNPSTMGSVANVGLMAQKAEEYGSHDKTFKAKSDGVFRIISESGDVLSQHNVENGDIFRACQTKDIPVENWVKLAVSRAVETKTPIIFWLDNNRSHDAIMIERVKLYLSNYDLKGLDVKIMSPIEAMKYTLELVKAGKDVISVTGNVLRDYLTDLFPILELASSSKMLSIVPLINGGGLFETGAGGSAPKHVEQFLEEGHLRWDSLGEFLALTVSLEHLASLYENKKASILSKTLDKAIEKHLNENRSPSRKVHDIDNRGSHFYLCQYWAEMLSKQNEDAKLNEKFAKIFHELQKNESKIIGEIANFEGKKTNIGGYYQPDDKLVEAAMRPSATFNKIIESI